MKPDPDDPKETPVIAPGWVAVGLLRTALLLSLVWGTPLLEAGTSLEVNRYKVVSAAGTPTQNCAGLRATVDAIDGSSNSRYLIELEPGKYSCGSETVFLKSFVTLQGAGAAATLIEGNPPTGLGVVNLRSHSELREVRVVNHWNSSMFGSDIVAVSAFAFTQIVGARLVDVEALARSDGGDDEIALLAIGADVEVWHSRLAVDDDFRNAVETTASSDVRVRFSQLEGGVTGVVVCQYSSTPTHLLDSNCAVVP